jgi:uncharacterized protein (DUF433 family)
VLAQHNLGWGGTEVEKHYVVERDRGYWIAGTRVSLDSVILAFLEGISPEAIVTECFPVLTLEQVYGAITYYLAHRPELDAYLRQAGAEFEALRQRTHEADPGFSRKLAKARRQMARVRHGGALDYVQVLGRGNRRSAPQPVEHE